MYVFCSHVARETMYAVAMLQNYKRALYLKLTRVSAAAPSTNTPRRVPATCGGISIAVNNVTGGISLFISQTPEQIDHIFFFFNEGTQIVTLKTRIPYW